MRRGEHGHPPTGAAGRINSRYSRLGSRTANRGDSRASLVGQSISNLFEEHAGYADYRRENRRSDHGSDVRRTNPRVRYERLDVSSDSSGSISSDSEEDTPRPRNARLVSSSEESSNETDSTVEPNTSSRHAVKTIKPKKDNDDGDHGGNTEVLPPRQKITGNFTWESSKYTKQVRDWCATGARLSMLAVVYPFLEKNLSFIWKLVKHSGTLGHTIRFIPKALGVNMSFFGGLLSPLNKLLRLIKPPTLIEQASEIVERPSVWTNAVARRATDSLETIYDLANGNRPDGFWRAMYVHWQLYYDDVVVQGFKNIWNTRRLAIMAMGLGSCFVLYKMSKLIGVNWTINIGDKIIVSEADHRPMPMAQLDIKHKDPEIHKYTRQRWLSMAGQNWLPWFKEDGHLSEEILSNALGNNVMSVAGDYETFRQKLDRCIETMHRVNLPRGHMIDWGNVGRHTGFAATGLWLRDRQQTSDMDF